GREQVAQGGEVAEAFRHLLAGCIGEELGVQPGARKNAPGGSLGLRDLVLVVRKEQVDPTGVDVESLTEIPHRHRRALDVPARSAAAERRLPAGTYHHVAGLLSFPEREI